MIASLTKFFNNFKRITDSHVELYKGNEVQISKWQRNDFNTDEITSQLDESDRILTYGGTKKAYDVVRSYYRQYIIYSQTREDYYRSAIIERNKDTLILDRIVTNLNNVNKEVNFSIGNTDGIFEN